MDQLPSGFSELSDEELAAIKISVTCENGNFPWAQKGTRGEKVCDHLCYEGYFQRFDSSATGTYYRPTMKAYAVKDVLLCNAEAKQ